MGHNKPLESKFKECAEFGLTRIELSFFDLNFNNETNCQLATKLLDVVQCVLNDPEIKPQMIRKIPVSGVLRELSKLR